MAITDVHTVRVDTDAFYEKYIPDDGGDWAVYETECRLCGITVAHIANPDEVEFGNATEDSDWSLCWTCQHPPSAN